MVHVCVWGQWEETTIACVHESEIAGVVAGINVSL